MSIKRPDDFKPTPTFPHDHEFAGSRRCHGWSRTQGRQCHNRPVEGRDYCRMHGGKVAAGPEHHEFRHGLRSRYLPAGLADIVQQAHDDADLIEYRADLALLEARLAQMLESLDGAGTATAWADLHRKMERMWAIGEDNPAEARQLLRDVTRGLREGAKEGEHWDAIFRLLERRRRTLDSEHKRRRDLQMYIPADVFLGAIQEFVAAVHRTVQNPVEKRALGHALDPWVRLLARQQGRAQA